MSSANPDRSLPLALQVILWLGAIGVLVGLMCWTYATPTMNGQHIGLWNFIGLWARELALLGFIAVGLVVALACRLHRLIRRVLAR